MLTCTSRWLVWRRSVVILPQQLYLCTQVRFVPINEARRQAGFEATISTSLHPLPVVGVVGGGCGCHPNGGAWDQTKVLCCGVTARVARWHVFPSPTLVYFARGLR